MNKWRVGTLSAALGLIGCYGSGVGIHQEANLEEPPPVDECTSDVTTIFAGQHIDAGEATISSDGTDLVITLTGHDGWKISEYHIYAGTGPVPVNRAGAPAPGQFPYKAELTALADSYTVRIPLAGLDVGCGDSLNIAIHTVMVKVVNGQVVDTQTGWGFGPNEYRRQWGWWFTTDICCDEPEGCVRPKGVWRESPAQWSLASLEIGGATYDVCQLDDILYETGANELGQDDESYRLAHQVIAVYLNAAAGADVDAQTAADLAAAEALLDAHPVGSEIYPANALFADFNALRDALYDYNNGLRELPLCDPLWFADTHAFDCP